MFQRTWAYKPGEGRRSSPLLDPIAPSQGINPFYIEKIEFMKIDINSNILHRCGSTANNVVQDHRTISLIDYPSRTQGD